MSAKAVVFRGFVGYLVISLVVYLSPVPFAYANPVLQNSPASGGSNDQANTFRRQIRSVLGACDEVSLLLVMERETGGCEVRAVYDRENAGQAEWVLRAEELSLRVWASLRHRRRGFEV
jgi:hypothetical protein